MWSALNSIWPRHSENLNETLFNTVTLAAGWMSGHSLSLLNKDHGTLPVGKPGNVLDRILEKPNFWTIQPNCHSVMKIKSGLTGKPLCKYYKLNSLTRLSHFPCNNALITWAIFPSLFHEITQYQSFTCFKTENKFRKDYAQPSERMTKQ